MKNYFLIMALVCTAITFSQNSKFSVSIAYPMTMGENYFNRNDGVFDLGAQYRFLDAKAVQVGVSLNGSFFNYTFETDQTKTTEKTFVAQPRVFAELNIPAIKSFKPFVGIGYAFTSFKNEFDNGQNSIEENTSASGLNLNMGISYHIFNGLFVQAQYDYIKAEREEGTVFNTEESFYQKINLLKLGVGYRF